MKFLKLSTPDSVTMRRIAINASSGSATRTSSKQGDGQEALAVFDESFGFIITDWNITGGEWASICTRTVRSIPFGRVDPGSWMVTTRGAREDIAAAMEAGINNYILKPFTPSVLKEKIDRLLATMSAAAVAEVLHEAERRAAVRLRGVVAPGRPRDRGS